jgi:tRNA-binding protein
MSEIKRMENLKIAYDSFANVDIRVGIILRAEKYHEAKEPSFKIWIDLGPEIGQKKTSAQVTKNYTTETLIGLQVACVVNIPPRQIGKFKSEVLLLGFPDVKGEVVLIGPKQGVPNGGKLY